MLLIVAGPVCETLAARSAAFSEVDRAASLLLRMDVTQRPVLTETMAAYHLLLQVPEKRILTDYAERVLAPLETYDLAHGTELTETDRCYLASNRKLRVTATRTHLHTHSVKYRLERAPIIMGAEAETPDFWFGLELALKIRDLLGDAGPRASGRPRSRRDA